MRVFHSDSVVSLESGGRANCRRREGSSRLQGCSLNYYQENTQLNAGIMEMMRFFLKILLQFTLTMKYRIFHERSIK